MLTNGQPVNVDQFIGLQLVDPVSNLTAIVVDAVSGFQSQNPDLNTLYIKYLNTGFINGTAFSVYSNSNLLNVFDALTNTYINSLSFSTMTDTYNGVNTYPVGLGYNFTVGEGIIYQKGTFVQVLNNISTIVSKYTNFPNNTVVGFTTEENIITVFQDPSLYDTASGSTNFNAPGADRLQLIPTLLVANANALPSNNFLPIVEWENGQIVRTNQTTVYNKIESDIAQRLYEQSGDFVVNPFGFTFQSIAGNNTYASLVSSSGTAYVRGYRIQTLNQLFTPIRKGTDFVSTNSQLISTDFGNYALVKNYAGEFQAATGSTIYLQDTAAGFVSNSNFNTTTAPGTTIGTARIYAIELEPTTPMVAGDVNALYRMYITDIKMNQGKNFANVASFYANTGSVFGFADSYIPANTTFQLQDTTYNSLLYTFGNKGTKSLANNASYTYRTLGTGFTFPATANAVVSISLTGSPGNPIFPYGAGLNGLNNNQEMEFLVIARGTANVTGNVGVLTTSTSSVNVVGNTSTTNTAFTIQYAVSDFIGVGSDTRQVVSVVNGSFLTVDAAFSNNWTNFAHNKVYPNNVPIPISGRNSSIIVSNNTFLAINLKNISNSPEQLANTLPVDIYYNVTQNSTIPLSKSINKSQLVVINTGTHAANTVGPWCLGVPDVLKITAVYKHNGAASTSNADLVTNSFILRNGQKDTLYDLAYLVLKPGNQLTFASGDYLTVKFDVFTKQSVSNTGFFTVDSYPIDDANTANTTAIQTAQIPIYKSSTTGTLYDLRNYIDFRPYIANTVNYTSNVTNAANATNINPSNTSIFSNAITSLYLPATNYSYSSNVVYYLSRYDKVTLNPLGNISIKEGIPATNPTLPPDVSGSMTLGIAHIPPYPSLTPPGASSSGRIDYMMSVDTTETQTFKMSDIANIQTSVSSLEYYATLSTLEESVVSLNYPNPNTGLNAFKNGIFVDDFSNLGLSNQASTEQNVGIDPIETSLVPVTIQTKIGLKNVSANTSQFGLSANQVIFVNQIYATNLVSAASGTQYNYTSSTYTPTAFMYGVDVYNVKAVSAWQNYGIPVADSSGTLQYGGTGSMPVSTTSVLVAGEASSTMGGTATTSPFSQLVGSTLNSSNPYTVTNTVGNINNNFYPGPTVAGYSIDSPPVNNTPSGPVSGRAPTTYAQVTLVSESVYVFVSVGMKPNTPVYLYVPQLYPTAALLPGQNIPNPLLGDNIQSGNVYVTQATSTIGLDQLVTLPGPQAVNYLVPNPNNQLMTDSTGACIVIFTMPQVLAVMNPGQTNFATNILSIVSLSYSNNFSSFNLANGLGSGIPPGSSIWWNGAIWNSTALNFFDNADTTFSKYVGGYSLVVNNLTSTTTFTTNMAQTFDVSPAQSFGNSYITVSSLDLFFGPSVSSAPGGVTVNIVDGASHQIITGGYVTPAILQSAGSNNASIATNVKFKPIPMNVQGSYYIEIVPDGNDPNIQLWAGTPGQIDVLTGNTAASFNNGYLYLQTNYTTGTATSASGSKSTSNLKFNLYVQQYSVTPETISFVNQDYEFLKLNSISGNFNPGEKIHVDSMANQVGTVSVSTGSNTITGSGTTFNTTFIVNNWITIIGSSNTFSANIVSITNSTSMVLSAKPSFTNATSSYQLNYGPGTVSVTQGNSTIIGNGTTFSNTFVAGHQIIVKQINGSNGQISDCLTINSIINSTALTVQGSPWFSNTTSLYQETPWGQTEEYYANAQFLILNFSTANGTNNIYGNKFIFSNTSTIFGQFGATANLNYVTNMEADRIQPVINTFIPQDTSINVSINVSTNSFTSKTIGSSLPLNDVTSVTSFTGYILSKSNEIQNMSGNKSFNLNATLSYNNNALIFNPTTNSVTNVVYSSPSISYAADVICIENIITTQIVPPTIIAPANNTSVGNTVLYGGLANCNYISQTITLGPGMDSENLQAFMTVYKPAGTKIDLYCRLLNSYDYENFGTKDWTLMQQISPNNSYSSTTNLYDYMDLQYGLPSLPPLLSYNGLGTASISNVSTTVTGSGTTFGGNATNLGVFSNGDLMVFMSGNTTVLHQVANVVSNTQITLFEAPSITNTAATFAKAVDITLANGTINVSSSSPTITGTNTTFTSNFQNGSFIQIISNTNMQAVQINVVSNNTTMNLVSNPSITNTASLFASFSIAKTAFQNKDNSNIVRYYNNAGGAYDSFKYYAFKIVMSTTAGNITPRVLNLRAVALSV